MDVGTARSVHRNPLNPCRCCSLHISVSSPRVTKSRAMPSRVAQNPQGCERALQQHACPQQIGAFERGRCTHKSVMCFLPAAACMQSPSLHYHHGHIVQLQVSLLEQVRLEKKERLSRFPWRRTKSVKRESRHLGIKVSRGSRRTKPSTKPHQMDNFAETYI